MDDLEEKLRERSFISLIANLFGKKLQDIGYLIEEDIKIKIGERFYEHLKNDSIDDFTIDEIDSTDNIILDLSDEDISAEDFNREFQKLYNNFLEEKSLEIFEEYKSFLRVSLQEDKEYEIGFQDRLQNRWGEAFDLLDIFIHSCIKEGYSFFKDWGSPSPGEVFMFDALSLLHTRACQVSHEVLTLIRAGYPDGAHARWRTLYELSVISHFIKKAGEETAEMYILYEVVDSYKSGFKYNESASYLNHKPLNPEFDKDWNDTIESYEQLKNRFGVDFTKPYGWASKHLDLKKITFASLESAINFNHYRYYYTFASNSIHTNVKGALFRLGTFINGKPKDRRTKYLVGPSNVGFTDPAHGTAIALHQATVNLLTLKPTTERLIACKVLGHLVDEVGSTFLAIQQTIEEEEKNKQS